VFSVILGCRFDSRCFPAVLGWCLSWRKVFEWGISRGDRPL